jgi:MOSC domain-containing protein YiiM
MEPMAALLARHAGPGRVEWIGLRQERLAPVQSVGAVFLTERGLEGDHASGGLRAVTLIQAEHLPVIAALAHIGPVAPETLRRNILVSGLNLSALRGAVLTLGESQVRITGPCAPCSRMEAALGPGGYNALRGHGGWCAEVVRPGRIAVGDGVTLAQS